MGRIHFYVCAALLGLPAQAVRKTAQMDAEMEIRPQQRPHDAARSPAGAPEEPPAATPRAPLAALGPSSLASVGIKATIGHIGSLAQAAVARSGSAGIYFVVFLSCTLVCACCGLCLTLVAIWVPPADRKHADNEDWDEGGTDSDAIENTDLASDLQTIAHRLPPCVLKMPRDNLSSLVTGPQRRYVVIVPLPANTPQGAPNLSIQRWRHARLTWWESKHKFCQDARPNGSVAVQNITGAEIRGGPVRESGAEYRTVAISHRIASKGVTLRVQSGAADEFCGAIKQYIERLQHAYGGEARPPDQQDDGARAEASTGCAS